MKTKEFSSSPAVRAYTMKLSFVAFAAAALAGVASGFAPAPASRCVSAPAGVSLNPVAVGAPRRTLVVVEAVPKNRQSKMKTRQRKAKWFAKADAQRDRAMALGRSVLSGSASSFIYNPEKDDEDEDDDEDDEEDDEEAEDDEE